MKQIPPELRALVKKSVSCLGEVIERELGNVGFKRIEKVRARMTKLRVSQTGKSAEESARLLEQTFKELGKLSPQAKLEFAKSYTLMLELMNTCENAYRTYRLKEHQGTQSHHAKKIQAITYVLTAHPTEARTTQNIAIFHQIQRLLIRALETEGHFDENRLKSLLEIAWRVPIVRNRKPRVEDEALHIYSIALRRENLDAILAVGSETVPVYLRSWVGGDKDGHPGVDEHSFQGSLSASRLFLYRYARAQVEELGGLLELFSEPKWVRLIRDLKRALSSVREIGPSDGKMVHELRRRLTLFKMIYETDFGPTPEPLIRLRQLLHVFPGLVIPLELREDSGLLVENSKKKTRTKKKIAIERMLWRLREISKGGDPKWYVQGFIVSMTEKLEHLEIAASLVESVFGELKLPVIPLFEQKKALMGSVEFVEAFLKHPKFKRAIREKWNGKVEIMLGYSDSSKESGVLPSRLAVSNAMRKLDPVFKKHKVKGIYFHGSGGSVDRGGGAVEDQLTTLSHTALSLYKATLQGEMVERNFASPEIATSQMKKIAKTSDRILLKKAEGKPGDVLLKFASKVEASYRETVSSAAFLEGIEKATPYRFLSQLKIGSRPTKRIGVLSVSALRAIPWVLCWTQTRVLFPTWWGVGSAWASLNSVEKRELTKEFHSHSGFRSYLHALGFTLAKIELPVFEFYISHSSLSKTEKQKMIECFRVEFQKTQKFYREITKEKNPLWFRPWLGESIRLRSSMIHPLNLLQILAEREKDGELLRLTVTGIASGMLTTG